MLKKKTVKVIEEFEHVHSWKAGANQSYQSCACGKILVSQAEYDRRVDEWDNYLDLLAETEAYKDFLRLKRLFRVKKMVDPNHALPEKEQQQWDLLMARIKQRSATRDYMPKPHFPDPGSCGFAYVVAQTPEDQLTDQVMELAL